MSIDLDRFQYVLSSDRITSTCLNKISFFVYISLILPKLAPANNIMGICGRISHLKINAFSSGPLEVESPSYFNNSSMTAIVFTRD